MTELEQGIQEFETATSYMKQNFITLVCLPFKQAVPITKMFLQRNEILLPSS